MDKTIGIIGGGQLALMLVASASKFGVNCICLDPNPKAIAFKYCAKHINADFDNIEALKKLENSCDIILYEFENIDLEALSEIDNGKLLNGIEVLKYSQNRILEKDLATSCNFKTVKYKVVQNKEELFEAIKTIGFGGILKTATLGYDGKGQITINEEKDITKALDMLSTSCIYEEKLNFDYEMSLIVVRNKENELSIFPSFINEHKGGILHKTILKKDIIDKTLEQKGYSLIKNFMEKNNFFGILCVEFFVKNNELYFNEMAPRPHNSGHVTLDATNISQFEQYVRVALNYKMVKPMIINEMGMINILGQHINLARDILNNNSEAKTYLYGKDKALTDRKMGHINMICNEAFYKIDEEFKNVK